MGCVELRDVIDCDRGVEPAVFKPQTNVETEAAHVATGYLVAVS